MTSYSQASEPLIRLTILVKKVDSMSYEEFHEYWRTSHPKVWLNAPIVQEKLVKYSQFHVNEHVSATLRSHGLPVAEYDGGVDMYGKSVEDIMAIFQDEEYNRLVVPDEQKFIKREEGLLMIGSDEVKLDGGKVLT